MQSFRLLLIQFVCFGSFSRGKYIPGATRSNIKEWHKCYLNRNGCSFSFFLFLFLDCLLSPSLYYWKAHSSRRAVTAPGGSVRDEWTHSNTTATKTSNGLDHTKCSCLFGQREKVDQSRRALGAIRAEEVCAAVQFGYSSVLTILDLAGTCRTVAVFITNS